MNASTDLQIDIEESEVILSCIINASRADVFKAFTEPIKLSKWWGPHSFSNPVCDIDLRNGGAYRIVMRSPEDVDYPIKGNFLEIHEDTIMKMGYTEGTGQSLERPDALVSKKMTTKII
ncbi:MAG: hypothetical protein HW421_4113 [Ignavibacteria bacterium]|nr:hypothetical protein [Ignavibacteria bacterium]